jgi:phosphonate transport system substrate-binding protein
MEPLNRQQQPQPLNHTPSPSYPYGGAPVAPQAVQSPQAPSKKPKLLIIGGAIVFIVIVVGGWALTHRGSEVPKATNTAPLIDKHALKVATVINEDGLQANTAEYLPFVSYLTSQLRDQGIVSGQFVAKPKVSDVAKLLKSAEVDVYIDNILPVFVADRLSGSTLMADRSKGGVEKYHTAIFVKKDSPVKTLADLKGKTIAMNEASSTTGYLIPKAELTKKGLVLKEMAKSSASVDSGQIGYQFVGAKVYDDVASGSLAAGAGNEQEIRAHFGANFDKSYRIIYVSPDVLAYGVTGRSNLDPALRAAIKTTLLNMDKTAAGRAALQSFGLTTKFSDVPADSDLSYAETRALTDAVQSELSH